MSNKAVGKQDAKPALMPKLRFPEFRDAPGWKAIPLGDLLPITSSKRVHESDWTGKGVPFYRAREIVALHNRQTISPLFISEELYQRNAKASGEIAAGHLLVTGVGSIGVPYLVADKDRFYFKDGNIIWLKNDGEQLLGQYLFLLYQTGYVQNQITTMAGVGTVGTYTIDNANKTVVPFPQDRNEQQKIAECLTTLDEVIAAQSQKIDALKTHKKGLMQQLFPREGETLPRLRFPEFRGAPEWEEKPLGDIAAFSSGGTPSKDNSKYWNGHIPWVSASSMYDTRLSKADHYVTALAIGNGTRIAKAGALLILVRGSMLFNRVPICIAMIDVAFNQDVKALDLDASVNGSFLFYQLLASESRIPINETGIGAGKIELDDLKGLEVYMPSPSEQQAVANCLSNFDDLIAAQSDKLESLKTHKKGLMQQLFPSPEEVEA